MTRGTDLVERLDEHVTPLDRCDPGGGLADLRPLAAALDGKRVVGLGEATHGTREFCQLKHRLVRLLVTELGFGAVGLEAPVAEVRPIDEYVVAGEGDPEAALSALSYWTWRTEGLLALVEWAREYNRDRPAAEAVRFFGFDVRSTTGPARALGEFLDRVDPDYLPEVADELRLLEGGWMADGHDAAKEEVLAAHTVATELERRFERREDAYRSAAGDREWRLARRHRRLVEQAYEFVAAGLFDDGRSPNGVRDAAMAENVRWTLDHESPDRVALWAHNGHVGTGAFRRGEWESPPETMGQHLRRELGDRYYALGFEFGRGSFRAYPDPETTDGLQIRPHSAGPIRDGSVPAVLESVGEPVCFLDVAAAATDPVVRKWFDGEPAMHSVGAVAHDDPEEDRVPVAPDRTFDGLAFVAETEPTAPPDSD